MRPSATAWPAVALHLVACAYLLLFTRDRADWTVGVFEKYGDLMRAGRVPYRDFVLEYPPLATPLMWLPSLVARNAAGYRLAFGLEVLAFDLLGVGVGLWLIRRAAPHIPPWGIVLAQPLWLLCAGRVLVFDRFDLPAAVLMLLAIALVVARRPRLAWLALGLATALKLYPVVLLPLFALVALSGGRRWRLAGDIGAFAAAIGAPGLLVARGDLPAVATFLKYHVDRGLEIETVYASALMVGRPMSGPVSQRWGHGGNEIVAPLAPLLASLTLPLTALALGAVYLVAWRGRRHWADTRALVDDLTRLGAAAVLAFMLVGKVLSPQYLLWLYPLVAVVVVGRRPLTLWAVYGLALLLTSWIFPAHYYLLVRFAPREVDTLVARNVVLLALAALTLLPLAPIAPSARRRGGRSRARPVPS